MPDSFDQVVEALESQQAHVAPENRHAATAAHELFVTLRAGGFTEDQALKVVAYRIAFSDTDEQEG